MAVPMHWVAAERNGAVVVRDARDVERTRAAGISVGGPFVSAKVIAARVESITANLAAPFAPTDEIPGTVEDAIDALRALAADLQ